MTEESWEAQHDPATRAQIEIEALGDMLRWAYQKLMAHEFANLDDALELDRIKLFVEHGVLA